MNLNKVILIGNLTRDPELRQTPSGQAVCTFGLATNRTYKDASGQKQTQAEFHNLVAWGKSGEIIAQYMKRGSSLMIEGRLQTRSWEDQQGKHYKTEIVIEDFQFGPRPTGTTGGGNYGDTPPRQGGSRNVDDRSPRPNGGGMPQEDTTPIIEFPEDDQEVDIKDIPF